jgi:hypothetical protein
MDGALKPFYFNYSFTPLWRKWSYLRCNEYRCRCHWTARNEGKIEESENVLEMFIKLLLQWLF